MTCSPALQRARGAHRHRRLRHRLLVARLPAALPVADELKIDRLVHRRPRGRHQQDEAIVSASIVPRPLAGLEVVAEGVETSRQFEALGRLGCGRAQGFLFSRAVDVDALATFVAEFHWPVP